MNFCFNYHFKIGLKSQLASERPPLSVPFLTPVDRKEVPDCLKHIKFLIDMKMMAKRLKVNYYVNKTLFITAMKRMFSTVRHIITQRLNTEYYNCANVLNCFLVNKLKYHGLTRL